MIYTHCRIIDLKQYFLIFCLLLLYSCSEFGFYIYMEINNFISEDGDFFIFRIIGVAKGYYLSVKCFIICSVSASQNIIDAILIFSLSIYTIIYIIIIINSIILYVVQ